MTKARRTISGRTAVISGAASGMGRSLAQRLAAYGSPVAITDIDELGLKETEASIAGPVLSRVLDVSDADAQLAFADEVRDWTPTVVGAVFNNAGVNLACTVLDANPVDDQWLWDINFHGVVNGTRAFLPILVEQDEGRDRQHLERLRPCRHAQPKCLLLRQVRGARLHRCATSGAEGHRGHRHQRPSRWGQHQHRAKRAVPRGSGGTGPVARPDRRGVRRRPR